MLLSHTLKLKPYTACFNFIFGFSILVSILPLEVGLIFFLVGFLTFDFLVIFFANLFVSFLVLDPRKIARANRLNSILILHG